VWEISTGDACNFLNSMALALEYRHLAGEARACGQEVHGFRIQGRAKQVQPVHNKANDVALTFAAVPTCFVISYSVSRVNYGLAT
jgi:hypothetical protein